MWSWHTGLDYLIEDPISLTTVSDTFGFLRRNNTDVVMPEMMCNNCFVSAWSTLIGPGMLRLGSHWSKASMWWNIFMLLLHQLSYAIKTGTRCPPCLGFHAQKGWTSLIFNIIVKVGSASASYVRQLYNTTPPLNNNISGWFSLYLNISSYFTTIDCIYYLLPARHWIRKGSPIPFPLKVSFCVEAVWQAGGHSGGRTDELHHWAPALLCWLLDFTGKCWNWPCKILIKFSSSTSSTTSTYPQCAGAKEPRAPAVFSCGRVCHISELLRALRLV